MLNNILAAIEKKRREEAAANKANQGWGISSWWYGTNTDTTQVRSCLFSLFHVWYDSF